MNKNKIISIFLICLFIGVIVFYLLTIRHRFENKQKIILIEDIRHASEPLMMDLAMAHSKNLVNVPVDGQWHTNLDFNNHHQITLKYRIENSSLIRISRDKKVLLSNHITALRFRRQIQRPDIVEIEIEAQNQVSLVSFLRIRILSH